jgi:hypothetical protein
MGCCKVGVARIWCLQSNRKSTGSKLQVARGDGVNFPGVDNERRNSGGWNGEQAVSAHQGDQQASAAGLQQADDLLPAGMHGQGGD